MLKFTLPKDGTLRIESGETTVAVYPEKAGGGANVTLLSNPEENPQTPSTVSWPGEYDFGGVSLRGIGHGEGSQVSFAATMDGMRIAMPSSPLQDLSDRDLELIGDAAVLVLPCDDAKLAQKLLEEIDPRVLIPLPGKDKAAFDAVLKAAGAVGKETVSEYKLKQLPAEGREVVLFS